MLNKGYDASFLEQLKTKSDIVQTISKYLPLNKKGKTYWGCCPFHHEKTPSFAVNENEQYYHCFGCGESGDVIKFVQKIDSLDFIAAITKLAENAGLEVPVFSGDEKLVDQSKAKNKLYAACNEAMEHYKNNLKLKEASIAREYLIRRGITEELSLKFNIGYSNGWTNLITYLRSKGITVDVMKQAGLAEEKNGRVFDVMAGRLMFPIINGYGDCVGFTARDLTDSGFAKYRNTTQTIIFDKSKTIYNINNIKTLKQEGVLDSIILVEGTMDVIALVRDGFENTAACLGTAITAQHSKELSRFSDKVILCMDGDEAGKKAAFRALDILLESGLDVRVVALPEKLDPDDYLKKYKAEGLKGLIAEALPAIDYKLITVARRFNLENNFEKTKYLKEVKPIIDALESAAEREVYLKLISRLTNISVDILRRDVGNTQIAPVNQVSEKPEDLLYRDEGLNKAIKFVLASLLHKKEYAQISSFKMHLKNSDYQKLYDYITKCNSENKVYTVSSIFDMFDVDNNKDIKELVNYSFNESGNEELYFKQSLATIYNLGLKLEFDELTAAYKTESDNLKKRNIAMRLSTLAKELKNKGDNLYV